MNLENTSSKLNSILKQNLSKMENSLKKEKSSHMKINMGRNETFIYDNLEGEGEMIMNNEGMRDMYEEAGMTGNKDNLLDKNMSILTGKITFENIDEEPNDFMDIDYKNLKKFEEGFVINKSKSKTRIEDQTRAESVFKLDLIENKVEEIYQHFNNLENFRLSYDMILGKLFGQNFELISQNKEIMNPEVDELLRVINGDIHNPESSLKSRK